MRDYVLRLVASLFCCCLLACLLAKAGGRTAPGMPCTDDRSIYLRPKCIIRRRFMFVRCGTYVDATRLYLLFRHIISYAYVLYQSQSAYIHTICSIECVRVAVVIVCCLLLSPACFAARCVGSSHENAALQYSTVSSGCPPGRKRGPSLTKELFEGLRRTQPHGG